MNRPSFFYCTNIFDQKVASFVVFAFTNGFEPCIYNDVCILGFIYLFNTVVGNISMCSVTDGDSQAFPKPAYLSK